MPKKIIVPIEIPIFDDLEDVFSFFDTHALISFLVEHTPSRLNTKLTK